MDLLQRVARLLEEHSAPTTPATSPSPLTREDKRIYTLLITLRKHMQRRHRGEEDLDSLDRVIYLLRQGLHILEKRRLHLLRRHGGREG